MRRYVKDDFKIFYGESNGPSFQCLFSALENRQKYSLFLLTTQNFSCYNIYNFIDFNFS